MTDSTGAVEAIFIAPEATKPATALSAARAVAGRGLEGDRYFTDAGTFSANGRDNGRDLTLVEGEALDMLERDLGVSLRTGEHRRNVVTRGVDLNALVGKRFRIGGVECVGVRPCHPCAHMESMTAPGVLRAMAGRGGLRAGIVGDGEIAVGDAIRMIGDNVPSASA